MNGTKTGAATITLVGLASALLGGCNYHIDKQQAVLPTDGKMMYAELCAKVLAPNCFKCHGGGNAAGGVALDDPESLVKDGIVVPGKPQESMLHKVLLDDSMPEGPVKLSKAQKEAVRMWIESGAPLTPVDVVPTVIRYADLQAKVLGVSCVRCHRGAKPAGKLSLETYEALVGGDKPVVIAGDPDGSLLYRVVRDDVMPPKAKISAEQKEILRSWISTGAKN